MSDLVRLSAALPGDPDSTVIMALVWFDVQKVTYSTATGTHVPTARIRKVEPIGESAATKHKVADLYCELNEARLGMSPLPFDQLESRTDHVDARMVDDDE